MGRRGVGGGGGGVWGVRVSGGGKDEVSGYAKGEGGFGLENSGLVCIRLDPYVMRKGKYSPLLCLQWCNGGGEGRLRWCLAVSFFGV